MLARLFKARWLLGCGALGALPLLASACGDSFVATGNAAAGSGDVADSSAGDAGDSPEGGAPSAGSENGGSGGSGAVMGGSAGKPGTCDCATGFFCNANAVCQSCKDFSSIHFTAPEKLTALAQAPGSIERFPRAGAVSSLFYTRVTAGHPQIWFASSPLSGVGVLVSSPQNDEGAAVLAPGFVVEQNLFFTRQVLNDTRKVVMGNWNGAAISNVQPAPPPINQAMADDYSFAVAPNAERAYWMSTRDGQPALYFQSVAQSGGATPNVLSLKIGNCDAQIGDDATPWVDLDGTVLMFRSQSLDADCKPSDSNAYDLFVVGLGSDGKPATRVSALGSLNTTGGSSNESDPSLSPDYCTVYFASDSGTRDYDLYRAQRN